MTQAAAMADGVHSSNFNLEAAQAIQELRLLNEYQPEKLPVALHDERQLEAAVGAAIRAAENNLGGPVKQVRGPLYILVDVDALCRGCA